MTAAEAAMFEVLHSLRLKGLLPLDTIAGLTGRAEAELETLLEQLAEDGLVRFRETPRLSGWSLTPEGHARHAEEMTARRTREIVGALTPVYGRFLTLNDRVKAQSGAWQNLAPGDAAGRWEAIEELGEINAEVAGILGEAAAIEPRFGSYRTRLAAALERLRAGDERYFTGVTVDSFHTVWFECHEDLIQTLGRERIAEGSF
jgi:hypothetical protein